MATDQLLSTMPQITLEPRYKVQFSAISPTTGAAITGVTVANIALTTLQTAQFEDTQPQPVAPIWVAIPLQDQ